MRKGKLSPRALDIDFDGGLVEEMADHGGVALLRWHRGKAGTVEHTHRVLKNELAAGVYPPVGSSGPMRLGCVSSCSRPTC